MRNIRKLLRPGGFLVVGEGSHTSEPGCFIFGTLPGWWLGYDEGRTLSPHVSPDEWHRVLRATGFSGIDTIAPQDFQDILGVSLFVSQAVDDKVNLLRQPLAEPPQTVSQPIEKLVLVGGNSSRSVDLFNETKALLESYATETYVFKCLEDVDYSIVDETSTVLSMVELDEPVFEDMSPATFIAFRKMFAAEKTILWVTSGRTSNVPWSNITVGFGRTAVNETVDLHLQHLDIPDLKKAESRSISEILLQLHRQAEQTDNILWAVEPEIVLDADRRHYVPRLKPLPTPNARYNSARRPITQKTDMTESPVAIRRNAQGITAERLSTIDTGEDHEDSMMKLRVTHAVLSAVQTPLGHQFLVIGADMQTGSNYLAFLPSLSSSAVVSRARAVHLQAQDLSERTSLSLAAAQIIGMAVIDPLFSGQTVVLHNPTELIAEAVATQASAKSVRAVCVTDATNAGPIPTSWVRLAPFASKAEVFRALPPQISSFVAFSSTVSENEGVILSGLPAHCHKATAKTLFSASGCETDVGSESVLGQLLQRALDSVQMGKQQSLAAPVLSIGQLDDGPLPVPEDPMSILDLTSSASVTAHFTRLDTKPMFKSNKTYWLAGLSGALGVSLCDWMIDRGARILVLSSRNPRIDPAWIESHKRGGVNITIIPWYARTYCFSLALV